MKIKNNFIARLGPNNTVRIFEAATGRLMREILAQGKVCNNPICEGSEVSVEEVTGRKKYKVVYKLPNGAEKSRELV
jgi:hypothetical protein